MGRETRSAHTDDTRCTDTRERLIFGTGKRVEGLHEFLRRLTLRRVLRFDDDAQTFRVVGLHARLDLFDDACDRCMNRNRHATICVCDLLPGFNEFTDLDERLNRSAEMLIDRNHDLRH